MKKNAKAKSVSKAAKRPTKSEVGEARRPNIRVKPNGSWWDAKYYPSVPYVFNLRMDPMEKMDPHSHEWGYIGRKSLASKLWAPTAAGRRQAAAAHGERRPYRA